MNEEKKIVEIFYDEVVQEVELAFCFKIGDKEQWVPKSVIHGIDDDENSFGCEEWFAYQEGLI